MRFPSTGIEEISTPVRFFEAAANPALSEHRARSDPAHGGTWQVILSAVRPQMKQPPCACRSQVEAEGTLRLHRQTGALHLARASPSVTYTGRGIDGEGGGAP